MMRRITRIVPIDMVLSTCRFSELRACEQLQFSPTVCFFRPTTPCAGVVAGSSASTLFNGASMCQDAPLECLRSSAVPPNTAGTTCASTLAQPRRERRRAAWRVAYFDAGQPKVPRLVLDWSPRRTANLNSQTGGPEMHSRLTLAIMALSLGGCFILAAPPPAFAQTGGQQHQKTAPSGADNRGKSSCPRERAPRKIAPRETAPRKIAPRKIAPRKSPHARPLPARPPHARPLHARPLHARSLHARLRHARPNPARSPHARLPPVRSARVDFAACRPVGPVGPQFTVGTLRRGAADTAHVAAAAGEPLERLVP